MKGEAHVFRYGKRHTIAERHRTRNTPIIQVEFSRPGNLMGPEQKKKKNTWAMLDGEQMPS